MASLKPRQQGNKFIFYSLNSVLFLKQIEQHGVMFKNPGEGGGGTRTHEGTEIIENKVDKK